MRNFAFVILALAALLGNPAPATATETRTGARAEERAALPIGPSPTSCEQSFKLNKCADFKVSLAESDQNKVVDCSAPAADAAPILQKIVGCTHGIADGAIIEAVLGLASMPAAAAKQFESAKNCGSDNLAKYVLLRNVLHTFTPEMQKIVFERWTCGQIEKEALQVEQRLTKSIDAKKDELKFSLERSGIDPTPEKIESQLGARLTGNERQYLLLRGPAADPAIAIKKKYAGVWNCYTTVERARLICDDLTQGFLTFAGALSISRAGVVAAPLKSVANARRPLTIQQATEVLGNGKTRQLLDSALKYVDAKSYASATEKAAELKTLLDALSDVRVWKYRKVQGTDGSTVFVGEIGHAVIVSPSGKVFRGKIPQELYYEGAWSADYRALSEYSATYTAPAAPPQ
jgi:hypothetical protein